MSGEKGVYLLNLAASGRLPAQEAPRAAGNFTIHVQDRSLSLEMQNLKHMPNSYQSVLLASVASALISEGREKQFLRKRDGCSLTDTGWVFFLLWKHDMREQKPKQNPTKY